MAHARYQLLAAVKALLAAATTPPWRSAHVANDVPPKAALPCAAVYDAAESSGDAGLNGVRRQDRLTQIDIKLYMAALPNPADNASKLHALASAAETVVTQAALSAYADSVDLVGTDPEYIPDERGYISITLHYTAQYATREGRPDTLGTD